MDWTDDRMDSLERRVDGGFARVDRELAALRGEIAASRTELKGDIDALRSLTIRFGVALMTGLLGVIAALIGAVASGALGG